MRSKWEEERGENWEPKGIFINFNMIKLWKWLRSFLYK